MNTTYKVGALSAALKKKGGDVSKKKNKKKTGEQNESSSLDSLFAVPLKRTRPLYVPYKPPELASEKRSAARKRRADDGSGLIVEGEAEGSEDEDAAGRLDQLSKKRRKRWPGKLKKEEMEMSKQEEEKRTVFVGNLSNKMGRKEIRKIFKGYGHIDTVRIRSAALADPTMPRRVGTITRDFHPKRNTLNAYVRFRTAEEAEAALKLNGTQIDKYHIRVDMAQKNVQHHNKRSVFLGNLPFDIEEETIFSHFEDCGDIEGVRLIRDPKTGIGKGFGYVIFKTIDPVELALRLDGTDLDGRNLRVSRAVQNPNRNFNASIVKLKKQHEAKTAKKAMKKTFTVGEYADAKKRGTKPQKKLGRKKFQSGDAKNNGKKQFAEKKSKNVLDKRTSTKKKQRQKQS